MFAEPVRQDQTLSTFHLKGRFKEGSGLQDLNFEKTRIPDHVMNYLIRNHLYRGDTTILFKKFFQNQYISGYNDLHIYEQSITNGVSTMNEVCSKKRGE